MSIPSEPNARMDHPNSHLSATNKQGCLENSARFNTVDPSESEPSDPIEMLQAHFQAQKHGFSNEPNPTIETRVSRLERLYDCVYRYQSQIVDAINSDFGNRTESETLVAEISPLLESIQYHIKNLPKWLSRSNRRIPFYLAPAKAYVQYQPLGVIGIIAPWNYPVYLSLGPLITALAAGNRAMLKLSELCPKTGETVSSIIDDNFSPDLIKVELGAVNIAQAFSRLPFDHLFFTGSTATGKKVMAEAAKNLTPVTLELGGKSPVIVGSDADMASAAKSIAFGKCFNAGQTCIAPDYVLCPKDQIEPFIRLFNEQTRAMYPSFLDNPDFTSIINDQHYQRLLAVKADAIEKGARVIESSTPTMPMSTRKLAPTIITNINQEMLIAQEEIFGPLLGLIPYNHISEAIQYIVSHPRPLALYYFGHNDSEIQSVAEQTHCGGIAINDTLTHVAVDDLPFGGVGASGMGQYHGKEGFLNFSKAKSFLHKGRFNSTQLIYPPWNRLPHKLLFKYIIKPRR